MVNKILALLYKLLYKNYNRYLAKELIKKYKLPVSTFFKGRVNINGSFSCGEGCKFLGDITISGNVELGRYVSINGPNTDIFTAINTVKIGSFTSIARNVSIQEYNHNFKGLTTYHIHQNIFKESRLLDIYSKGDIEIGNDVWIGTHCVILSGVKIGNGAIIAANSVVNTEIPAYAIAAGSPAKVIGYRFERDVIEKIEKLAWWNWDLKKIELNKEIFGQKEKIFIING
ncbi:MAG: CatB-related O-acetyltransferase [Chitinophagaceae bacterium]